MRTFSELQENDVVIDVNTRVEWVVKYRKYLKSDKEMKCLVNGLQVRPVIELNPNNFEYIGFKMW